MLTDRDEMSNLHRGHSIDASCNVLVNLAERFQRRFFLIGQSETRIACGGPCLVMDQVSVHLADGVSEEKIKM